ncbi:unnamed protein product [Dimorphilus gyrociliatus]|uniref:C2H2-type domain-containing protein n=1 Tax=Dimorphilus gyrociliatus TaxID=2664684 RepID=A0A7I8V913_9ANNE|nr:unnamed protein product [Dimorphilus gyrociliatus]
MEFIQNNEQEVKIEAGAITSETVPPAITLEIVSPGMLANLKNGDGSVEAKFICKFCNKPQSSRSYLVQHENNHLGIKPYKCDECNYVTSFRKTLTSHKKNAHNKNKATAGTGGIGNVCKQCGHKALSQKALELHEKMEHENACFKCATCGFMTKQISVYKNHIQTHRDKRKYSCIQCNYETSDSQQYQEHITENHSLKCPHCNFLFSHSQELSDHVQHHENVLQHFCVLCSFSSNLETELIEHAKVMHKDSKLASSVQTKIFPYETDVPADKSPESGLFDKNSKVYEYRQEGGIQEMSREDFNVLKEQTESEELKSMQTKDCEEISNSSEVKPIDDTKSEKQKYKKIYLAKHEETHTDSLLASSNPQNENKRNLRESEDDRELLCDKCTYKATTSGALLNHKRIKHDDVLDMESDEEEIDVSDDDQFVPKPKKKKGKEPKRTAWICIDLEDVWRTWPN